MVGGWGGRYGSCGSPASLGSPGEVRHPAAPGAGASGNASFTGTGGGGAVLVHRAAPPTLSPPPPHPPVQVQLASLGGGARSTPRAPQQSLEAREQQGKRREVADGAPRASELRRSPRR